MKFLIIEDHPLVRKSMVKLLQQYFPDVQYLEHHNFEQAVDDFKQGCPDLILLDLTLPGMHGLEVIRHILSAYPEVRLLVISGSTNPLDIQHCLEAGAKAYLSKTDSTAHMVETIKKVLRGEEVKPQVQQQNDMNVAVLDEHKDILKMIAAGHSNKDIAQVLGISEASVKAKCRQIYQKLGVNNRTQALGKSRKLGIL